MVNKCVIVGCNYGYRKRKCDAENADLIDGINIKKSSFHFPSAKNSIELHQKWIKFVSRKDESGSDWKPSENSVICQDHFDNKYL